MQAFPPVFDRGIENSELSRGEGFACAEALGEQVATVDDVPLADDFLAAPLFGALCVDVKYEVRVVRHDGVGRDIDGEGGGQQF